MDKRNGENNPQDTRRVPTIRSGAYGSDPELAKTRKITTAPQNSERRAAQGAAQKQGQKGPAPKGPRKSHLAILLVTTVFVGVVAAVFVFAMMFNELSAEGGGNTPGQPNTSTTQPQTQDPVDQDPLPVEAGHLSFIGVVQDMNTTNGRVEVYEIENSRQHLLFVEGHSVLRDKFGEAMTFPQFSMGDVVEIVHVEDSTTVETMRISAQVTTMELRDIVIDEETNMLLIGNSRYAISSRTVVMHQGTPSDVSDLATASTARVDIFREHVVFVDILQGSGTIRIPSNDTILQGSAEISGIVFAGLDGETDIRAPEGTHRLIIRGANIELFEQDITVTRGGITTASFDGMELLSGSLTVNVEDPLVTLTINGEAHITNTLIILEHGTYTVSVTRDGFMPFSRDINVTASSPNHEMHVALQEIIIPTQNITITTSPPGARIYIDGAHLGLSPVSTLLEFGSYTVTMILEGYMGGNSNITVAGNQEIFSFLLAPNPNYAP
ncbi:MAG: PEGA domain-containing protein [Defluviitaleaceae bacterium]|nr:PEGA domain-containing protein [Defluviitaleaceae bacterium]